MRLFEKLFVSGNWNIATRTGSWEWPLNYEKPFKSLVGEKGYWYADPMVVTEGKESYLFCEAFNIKKQIGELAVFTYNGDNWVNPKIIISNNYHMSYPCVFKYKGRFYMIPETQEAKRLEIYESKGFPYKWGGKQVILDGETIEDPTVFEQQGDLYIVGTKKCASYSKLQVYSLDIAAMTVKLDSEKESEEATMRPAGYLIPYNDHYLRPAQDCRSTYGKEIIWKKFSINDHNIIDQELCSIDNSMITVDGHRGIDRNHTFSRSGDIEVIDYSYNRIDIFKRIKILWRQYKRHQRKGIKER